jgi:ribosomal protein S18 acetylase RimI-like enzyme
LLAEVRETPWGAVVTDGRFPALWDANYARVDAPPPRLTAEDIEQELLPALVRAGSDTLHVVSFFPDRTTRLLSELSSRGHRLRWESVMELRVAPDAPHVRIKELTPGEELWSAVGGSLELFGTTSPDAVAQLQQLEQEVLTPGGKRWFGVVEDGRIVSLAASLVLDGVAYVDNVATFPEARGRGLATAVTAHLAREGLEAGASTVSLLADPDSPEVVRMYRQLGFRETGRLASTRGPMPTP